MNGARRNCIWSARTFNLGIDSSGNLALPPIAPGFDPDRLSIEKLNIEDGHAVLTDSRSGSRITLDKLWFNGDVRSLAGPFRGDGAFVLGGDLYGYRIAAGRAEEGALKLRLNIDPLEKPLAVEADGTLSFPGSTPRFEGALTMSRPAGIATAERADRRQRSLALHHQGEGERGVGPV